MIDVNRVPNAETIANRIFAVVNIGDIEQGMILNVLSEWNNEWIDIIAEQETGMADNVDAARKHSNEKRLKDRINKLGSKRPSMDDQAVDNTGF